MDSAKPAASKIYGTLAKDMVWSLVLALGVGGLTPSFVPNSPSVAWIAGLATYASTFAALASIRTHDWQEDMLEVVEKIERNTHRRGVPLDSDPD